MNRIVALLTLVVTVMTASAQTYAGKVNTLIGTKGSGLTSGYLFPGATYPHGMVQFTPSYFAKHAGFVINQASGGGCEHMGNFPTFPVKGSLTASPDLIRNARITVTSEEGQAGYYKAMVQGDVKAELTVTARTGMARYTYPDSEQQGTVIIGVGLAANPIKEAAAVVTTPHSVEGYADGGSFCGSPTPYKVYFYAEFDRDAIVTGTWKDKALHPGATFAQGENSGLYLTFDLSQGRELQYRVGISYVSVENAKENLCAENDAWSFDATRTQCQQAWDKTLGMIEIQTADEVRARQFYTHLYRAFIHPSVCSDVNGEYMGADFAVHKTNFKQYTQFSNWDTYRTQIQLLAMLEPQVASDIVVSHQDFAQQSGGSFPRWVMANIETGIMQGDPSAILVCNAWAFGARNYDPKPLFTIMRKGAEEPGAKSQSQETRPHLKQYLEKGWCPASMQLEYTSADFAIGQFALYAVGDAFTAARYQHFARSWKNLWNEETGWLQSRHGDGSWKGIGDDWREATYKDYFWMVPYNIKALVELCGGNEKAVARLDEYFSRLDAGYGDEWFASGNEPSWGIPWVYNWCGQPWKTSQVIRRVLNEQYTDAIDGLPGNDDLGSMGSWYVWACLGLYPEIPAVAGFSLNTPLFPKAIVHLPAGDLIITGGSEKTPYTRSLLVNGKKHQGTWLPLSDIEGGATLQFSTSAAPDKKWGTDAEPPSFE